MYRKVNHGTWETLSILERVSANNPGRKECRNDIQGVGSIHSSEEAGNDRGAKGLTLVRNGKGAHSPNSELEELWKRN